MAKSTKNTDSTAKATAKPRKTAAKKAAASTNGTAHTNGSAMSNVTPISISREKVAELAHRFWNERGRAHGHDAEDWFRAEQELRGKAS